MKSKTDYIPFHSNESDFKERGVKHNLSKYEYDLYKEEEDLPTKLVRVKRVGLPNKGENWRIYEDNKVIETIEGTKLSTKEKDFLKTVNGVNFIIKYYKSGWKSFNNFKSALKSHVK